MTARTDIVQTISNNQKLSDEIIEPILVHLLIHFKEIIAKIANQSSTSTRIRQQSKRKRPPEYQTTRHAKGE